MIKYKLQQSVDSKIDSIVCNMCGSKIEKNEYNYFNDYISVEKKWGYHSPFDGENHKFDLCVHCYKQLEGMLKIPPEID